MVAKDSGSAAAKRLAEEKAERSNPRRTDRAGRSGFGETSSSNLSYKGGPGKKKINPDIMPARQTAMAASQDAGGSRWSDTQAGRQSMKGASDYAKKQRIMRNKPGRPGGY